MSRYQIPHDTLEAWVGWDAPMQTFFAQISDMNAADDDFDLLMWVGSQHDEIKTVSALQDRISGYVVLPADIAAKLEADMANAKPRTVLQERVRHLFAGVR